MSVVNELKALAARVQEELDTVEGLRKENESLREHAKQVAADQADALDKYKEAQKKLVEAVAERDALRFKFDKLRGLVE